MSKNKKQEGPITAKVTIPCPHCVRENDPWPDFIDLENVRIIEPGPGKDNHPPCLAEAMYGDLDAVLIPMDHYIQLSAMVEHCLDRVSIKTIQARIKKVEREYEKHVGHDECDHVHEPEDQPKILN